MSPQFFRDVGPQRPGRLLGEFAGALLALALAGAPLVLGAARTWAVLPLLLLLGLASLLSALRWFLASRPKVQIDFIDGTVVAFLLYTVVRWATSPAAFASRLELLNVAGYAAIFWVCRYGLARSGRGLFLLGLLVVLGLFEVGFAFYLSHHLAWTPFGETEVLHRYYAPRWVGTYGCPNHLGALLVMACGAALVLAMFSRLPWPLRLILFYGGGMLAVGVLYTASRGSGLGLLALLLTLGFSVEGRRIIPRGLALGAVAALIALFVAAACTIPKVRDRFLSAPAEIFGPGFDRNVRVELARDALHIARDHPWFGTGPATFIYVHPRYQSSTFAFQAELTHDDYLNALADYGAVGLGLILVFLFGVTRGLFRPFPEESRWADRVLRLAPRAAWFALLVHSLVDFNLHIPANAFWIFALAGLGLRRSGREAPLPENRTRFSPEGRWLPGLALVASLVYLAGTALTACGDWWYEKAVASTRQIAFDRESLPRAIAQARQALAFDPGQTPASLLLGDIHLYQANRAATDEARELEGQQALECYQQARLTNSLDDAITARLGLAFDRVDRSAEAFACFQEATIRQPFNGLFWIALGDHFQLVGQLERARDAYRRAQGCPHGGGEAAAALGRLKNETSVPP